MAYQSGQVSSFANLQTEIESFLVAQGYTNISGVLTKAGVPEIHMQFNGSLTDYLQLTMGRSSSGATLLEKHPGGTSDYESVFMVDDYQQAGVIVWPINYFFHYVNSPVEGFWCFIEYNSGRCQHIGFGMLDKATNYEGGVYIDGQFGVSAHSTAYRTHGGNHFELWNANPNANPGSKSHNPIPFMGHFSSTASDGNHPPCTILWAALNGMGWWNSGATELGVGSPYLGSEYDNLDAPASAELLMRPDLAAQQELQEIIRPFNSNNSLVPIKIMLTQPVNEARFRAGDVYDMRYTLNRDLNFGDIMDDGTDKWKVYPVFLKGQQEDAIFTSRYLVDSGWLALAVRYDGP